MSEKENTPPQSEELTQPSGSEVSGGKAPRRLSKLLKAGLAVAFFAALGTSALYIWISSSAFEETARKWLIANIENATGGRVEIAAFHWHPLNLEMEVDGLKVHGLEAATEVPYLQVGHLRIRVSLFILLSPRILLRELRVDQPALHLIVYPDGSTNQPHPKKTGKPGKSGLETLFNLQAGHVVVDQGVVEFENRAASFDFMNRFKPLNLDARDVSVLMSYLPAGGGHGESYHIETGARDLNLVRTATMVGPDLLPTKKALPPVEGFLQATLDLTRTAASLQSLRITARGKGVPDRTLTVSGELRDFARPHWDAKVRGELDLRLLESMTGYPSAPAGIAHLDLAGAGTNGIFRADGAVHVDNGSYIGTGVVAPGINLDAHVHADAEQLQITSIVARLRQGGQLEGDLNLAHWLPPIPTANTMQQATISNGKTQSAHSKTAKPAVVVKPVLPADVIELPVDGKVTARFRNVALDTLLEMVSLPPFQHLGFDSRIDGPATANWVKGDVRTLSVDAQLNLSAPLQVAANKVPATGVIDATYTQRNGAVDLRKLEVRLPASQVTAHGHLGAYPLTSLTGIAIDVQTANLTEWDTLLRDLGVVRNGKSGTAALPVLLAGQAEFHGNWTNSLSDPKLTGNAKATQLDLELPVPAANSATPLKTQFVHWDSLEGTGSYSSTQIDIKQGELRKGAAEIDLDGTLTGDPCTRKPALCPATNFDGNSRVHARLFLKKVNAGNLQSLVGQTLPFTGTMDSQVGLDGVVRSLNGKGWVDLTNGKLYGEPFTRIHAQGNAVGQDINLAALTFNGDAGNLSATGNFDLKSKHFQVEAQGANIDIARVRRLQQQGVNAKGNLLVAVRGSGTLDDPQLTGKATLTGLELGGEALGNLEATANTANHQVIYNLSTRLEAAELVLHGKTSLEGDYSTQARLDFSRFNIGALLKMAKLQGLNGESSLAGTITLDGPLGKPDQVRGEARLQELAVTVSGVHLRSAGEVHATLANSRLSLDPLHVTGEDTDLHIQGTLSLKDRQQLDLATSGSINLKVAQTLDPDLTASGSSIFQIEAHGPLQAPNLRGHVSFENGSLALEDLPNSLSQLRGSLEFNQNRLEVKSLTATTGGGLLSLSGNLTYQHGLFADLTATGQGIRIRYPAGISSMANTTLHLQGPQNNLLFSGEVFITRFSVSPDFDFAGLAAQANAVQTIAPPDAPSNHVRLDVHVLSSPQMNFQNAYAKLAGDVDLRLRGTVANPSLLGRVSIIEGSAVLAGTRYDLQRGELTFNNPVRIQPLIDLNATARVEDYDITLGLHGTLDKPAFTYRSDPPLPEADVVALLALGRTQDQQRLYTSQQMQTVANPTTDALLGGALNATVSSRVQKLFGAGSVKVDPNYLGALGNSTSRIIVEEQLGRYLTLTYATNVNTTGQQLIQAEVAINRHVSLLMARDESGVFSMVLKATRRYK